MKSFEQHKIRLSVLLTILLLVAGVGFFVFRQVLPRTNNLTSAVEWTNYENSQYGFSFEHPADWYLYASKDEHALDEGTWYLQDHNVIDVRTQPEKDCDSKVNDCPKPGPDADAFEVIVNENYEHLNLKDYATKKEGTENRQYVDTSVDGMPALKVTGLEGLGAGDWNIYIVKDDIAYIISQNLMDDNQFAQILSTFKFTK